MLTILVINSKVQEYLTTNLAASCQQKFRTAIMDYDPQGSSLGLRVRPDHLHRNWRQRCAGKGYAAPQHAGVDTADTETQGRCASRRTGLLSLVRSTTS
jgi:hypothetical protein